VMRLLRGGGTVDGVKHTIPELVQQLRSGSNAFLLKELTPALYDELHRLASRHLSGERSNH